MVMSADGLKAAEQKMRDAGHPDEAIRAFRSAYERLEAGESGMMPTDELEPATDVPSLDELPEGDPAGALEQFAVIKLNGGLATTMGLRSPKSLLEAREGRTFLDIIIGQTLALRRRFGVRLPLELMDSDATRDETLAALAKHPGALQRRHPPRLHAEHDPQARRRVVRTGELAATSRLWNGTLLVTATSTARCGGRACWRRCSSRAFGTR